MTLRWRLVPNDRTIVDLVEIFQVDDFTRVTGLSQNQVPALVFFNNIPQPWSMVSGEGITDAQILAGYVYWSEAQPGLGIYSVRWRPDAVGFWRLSFTYSIVPQIVNLDYDVMVLNPTDRGLKVSFIG